MRLVLMYGLAGYNSGECSLLDMVFKWHVWLKK